MSFQRPIRIWTAFLNSSTTLFAFDKTHPSIPKESLSYLWIITQKQPNTSHHLTSLLLTLPLQAPPPMQKQIPMPVTTLTPVRVMYSQKHLRCQNLLITPTDDLRAESKTRLKPVRVINGQRNRRCQYLLITPTLPLKVLRWNRERKARPQPVRLPQNPSERSQNHLFW